MRILVSAAKPSAAAGDCLVFLSHPSRTISLPSAGSARQSLESYARAVKSGRMKRFEFAPAPPRAKVSCLILAGVAIGSRKTWPECEQFRGAANEVYKHCRSGEKRRAVFLMNGPDGPAAAPWIAEGLLLGAYSFQQYKKKIDRFAGRFSAELIVDPKDLAEAKAAVERAVRLSDCINLARDLINQPGSVAVPVFLAQAAAEMSKEAGLECEIWDEKRLAEEGYNGLLTVGRGSADPPRMVVMRHRPEGAPQKPHLCLVGKGLTFDSGGMCLKSGSDMWEMISDMSGAAAVLGAMKAIAQTSLPIRVTGVMVCSPNYIGPNAVKPGDCFVAKNGKTVHVLNTDAEGRLILTDGLARAGEEGATCVVDVATLTGSCARALGNSLTGLFANDQALADRLRALGEAEGEQMWQLPLFDEYRRRLDHYRADINNTATTSNGGAITAALFLREFVPRGAAWAHLDIAGTAFSAKPWRYLSAGARGVMVRTLQRLAHDLAPTTSP